MGTPGQSTDRLQVVVSLQRGVRVATTFRLDAQGRIAGQVGDPVVQDNYEYELYRLATALYPDCPSAGFEYLRFGRILGPDTTNRVENWQLVRYSDTATGYINLADPAHQVSVLSDADFPMLWQRLEEGAVASPTDGFANIQRLTELLQLPALPSSASLFAPPDFATRAREANVAATLRHFICKHPTEWDASNLEARYAELRNPANRCMGTNRGTIFKDHVDKLAFWARTGIADPSVWHFDPLGFIRHYRKCLWLSNEEFAQCIPRSSRADPNLPWTTAITRARAHSIPYNRFIRKYCGYSRSRYAHNLAQTFIETGLFRTTTEDGRGRAYPYAAFFGRGYHQLTWAANYRDYGSFRGLPPHRGNYSDSRITQSSTHPLDAGGVHIQWSPRYDPALLEMDPDHAAESSGFYWVSKSFRGRKNMNRVADLEFDELSVAFSSWLVNGGGNGYPHRQQFGKFLANVLMDEPLQSGNVRFSYPPLAPPGNPTLCRNFPPTRIEFTQGETVNYASQTPA